MQAVVRDSEQTSISGSVLMAMRCHRPCLAAAIVSLALAGCGGASKVEAPPEAAPVAEEIKRRSADEMPAIDGYLPPLDDGRVEIAPPAGWKVLSRRPNYLANFTKGKASELPRISITVGEPPEGLDDVTEENAAEFARAIAKRLKSEKKTSIAEPPKPIILGDVVWSRHVRNPLNAGDPVAIQTLQTIRGGRLYTIDLMINVPSPENYAAALQIERDQAYAVAANMKWK